MGFDMLVTRSRYATRAVVVLDEDQDVLVCGMSRRELSSKTEQERLFKGAETLPILTQPQSS
jgi:hypothetical protein